MIPPRRATRDGGNDTANAATDRENLISSVWCHHLLPNKAWRLSKSGPDNWTFVPASVVASVVPFDMKQVRKHGTEGIHYANGWKGLADMYETYGEDYAPSLMIVNENGADTVSSTRRETIDAAGEAEEVAALEVVGDNNNDGQAVIKIEDEAPEVIDLIKVEDEEEALQTATVAAAPGTTQAIEKIVDCINKVNAQIAWLNENPNEQTVEQAERMKQQFRRTKERLRIQLEQYDMEDQVVS